MGDPAGQCCSGQRQPPAQCCDFGFHELGGAWAVVRELLATPTWGQVQGPDIEAPGRTLPCTLGVCPCPCVLTSPQHPTKKVWKLGCQLAQGPDRVPKGTERWDTPHPPWAVRSEPRLGWQLELACAASAHQGAGGAKAV